MTKDTTGRGTWVSYKREREAMREASQKLSQDVVLSNQLSVNGTEYPTTLMWRKAWRVHSLMIIAIDAIQEAEKVLESLEIDYREVN